MSNYDLLCEKYKRQQEQYLTVKNEWLVNENADRSWNKIKHLELSVKMENLQKQMKKTLDEIIKIERNSEDDIMASVDSYHGPKIEYYENK